jgi:hypothetical protein
MGPRLPEQIARPGDTKREINIIYRVWYAELNFRAKLASVSVAVSWFFPFPSFSNS